MLSISPCVEHAGIHEVECFNEYAKPANESVTRTNKYSGELLG